MTIYPGNYLSSRQWDSEVERLDTAVFAEFMRRYGSKYRRYPAEMTVDLVRGIAYSFPERGNRTMDDALKSIFATLGIVFDPK